MRVSRLLPFLVLLGFIIAGPATAASDPAQRTATFAGTGVWVDIYDETIKQPDFVVSEAVAHGVTTIYVETSNYHSPADVMFPDQIRQMITLAHQYGIKVVPWYLPGYKRMALDRRRLLAAVNVGGADLPVDGLGIDIEADIVSNRVVRAARVVAMVQWTRATFPDLPIAGIVPRDALAWWRIFPYTEIRANTDAMLPMCYTSRNLTPAQTTAMTAACVTTIREQTGDPNAPVHVIAGVTDFLKTRQLIAAARGAKAADSIGFSLYNLETTTAADWRALEVWQAPTG